MKHIAIIGGTGSTGKEVVRLALAANYTVTLVVRKPHLIQPETNLKVVKGDVTDLESLTEAFKNIDAVISCFGPSSHKQVGDLMSSGTMNIVKACKTNGVKRFVFMSGFVQTDPNEFSFLNKLAVKLLRSYFGESYADKVIAEAAIRESALNWVIVRAPGLAKSQPTGNYKAGAKIRIAPFKALPFADCAKCLLDAVEETSWTRAIINLGRN